MSSKIPEITNDFYLAALPIFILSGACVFLLLFTLFKIEDQKAYFRYTISTLVVTCLSSFLFSSDGMFLGGSYIVDPISKFGQTLILSVAIVITIFFKETHQRNNFFTLETTATFLMTILGMLVMIASYDFITLFIGLELSSIGVYILVGYTKPNRSSLEGAIKYFIMGSIASAILLLGISFIYASSGTLYLHKIIENHIIQRNLWLQVGGLLVLVGIMFKLALIPFHSWSPDAYESAPTGITAFMATAMKIMILIVTVRFSKEISLEKWSLVLIVVSALSMIGGNILALIQSNMKRLLAYSSIAHSGYIAIALSAIGSELSYQAIAFYLISYTTTLLLAFGVLMWLEDQRKQNLLVEDLSGLASKHPWAAFTLALAMFSFAGFPPTAGFFGKFFIFNAALDKELYSLVIIGALGSTISLFYYLNVVVTMYMRPEIEDELALSPKSSVLVGSLLAIASVVIISLGTVFPGTVVDYLKPITNKLKKD